jgi:hypothetical protein
MEVWQRVPQSMALSADCTVPPPVTYTCSTGEGGEVTEQPSNAEPSPSAPSRASVRRPWPGVGSPQAIRSSTRIEASPMI